MSAAALEFTTPPTIGSITTHQDSRMSAMPRAAMALSIVLAASSLTAQRAPAPPPGFDAHVARVMERFEVPGMAIAIVKDGQVVLAKGYGVKQIGMNDLVDATTRFGIASNSKLMTATALGLLVEEGKLEWDAPVIRYLPGFAMYDPWVTRELTVRDLLVHRSGLGLGAGDLLWWPPSTYGRKEIMDRLRHIRPATSFRTSYAYDNVLYLVAGEVIEAVSGQSWEEFVKGRILDRIGMTASDVRYGEPRPGDNISATHAAVDGKMQTVPPMASDNTNPAGGVMSGAADMAKWLMVQLDSGRVADGGDLFSRATTRELWSIVTPIRTNPGPAALPHLGARFAGYALGLHARDYRGEQFLNHTGGLPGYISIVGMMPGQRLGIAILTNAETSAMYPIIYHVIDYYLGVQQIPDYLKYYGDRADAQQAELAKGNEAAAAARDSASRPSLALDRYAGSYRDAWYGDVAITLEQGKPVLRFTRTPVLVGDMVHWQHDTWLVRWRDRSLRADAFITFSLNADGSIRDARMIPASPEVDFSYDFQDLELVPVKR